MCVKLLPGDLNPGPCPSHPTNTYTCGVTIAPRVCGGGKNHIINQPEQKKTVKGKSSNKL